MSNAIIYRIPKGNMPYFEARFGDILKKATKLNVAAPILTIHGEENVTEKDEITAIEYTRTVVLVSVEGEAPKIAGWTLVAVIEPFGDERIVRTVPGQTCPEEYRTTSLTCDHCKTSRRRSEVFVLKHDDGIFKQVGRNCLADFLGGLSPESLLKWCEYVAAMTKTAEESEFEGLYGSGPNGWDLDHFQKATCIVIRRFGWLSRSKAFETGMDGYSTSSHVIRLLTARANDSGTMKWIRENELYPEEKDAEEAAAAIEFGKSLHGGSDYEHNLGVICRAGWVKWEQAGYVASLIACHKRHQDRMEEMRKEREKKNRIHVGEVGKRLGFEQLTIKRLHYFEGAYGVKTLVRFEDTQGAILIWWASGEPDWLKEGETLDITGTVKEHGDYKGTPQTVLQRVVVGLPKVKKKAA